jgi:voltage-gated potassium channel
MRPGRKFFFAIAALISITMVGTVGYILIERMSFIDALYMSVITLSTVGYGEVHPLSPAGRIFTIAFILTGVGTAFYLFTVTAELIIEGRLREFLGTAAMTRRIHQMENHIIVCGFGRFGRVVVEELARNRVPQVVIDNDPAVAADLDKLGVAHLNASALLDEVLDEAGVKNARAIVVATGSEADNVYITLSAREKNPKIEIHARGETESGIRRLKLAGAHQVVSVFQRGGMRIAASILRPAVVDFLELATPGRGEEIDLDEIRIVEGSRMDGRAIRDIESESRRLRIVALKRGPDPIRLIPDPSTTVAIGDLIVAIGDSESLKRLADLVGSR